MDFTNAQLPALLPLKNSIAQNNFDTENELRNLFIELFNTMLAEQVFNENVLGIAQLGSLDLIKRFINNDGLVLLPGEKEELATRYTYKAWKSRNNQGRGLYFLRTYLQMIFPNASAVEQLAQPKNLPYPSGLIPHVSADDINYYLTSRLLILLDYDLVTWQEIDRMSPVIRSIVAARFVVHFGKIVTSRPKVYVGCRVITSAIVTVYPYQN
jgi:hypothetical protein